MATLLYRGHTYESKTSTPSPDVTLTYKRDHFKKASEQVSRDLKKALTYRGQAYTTPVDAHSGQEQRTLTYRGVTYTR